LHKVSDAKVPTIVFSKAAVNGQRIAGCGCDAVGLDWTTDMATAAPRRRPRRFAGHLDPQVLLTTPTAIESEAPLILNRCRAGAGPHFQTSAMAFFRRRRPKTSLHW